MTVLRSTGVTFAAGVAEVEDSLFWATKEIDDSKNEVGRVLLCRVPLFLLRTAE